MVDVNCEGVYTKTQAFNFLKKLLNVPKKVKINKAFFGLFFEKCDDLFIIKKPEDIIKNVFTEKGIAQINETYHKLKEAGRLEEAERLATEAISAIQESLAA